MKSSRINIDFKLMANAFRRYVRHKAITSGSTIIYLENGQLIEEDPKSLKKIVVKTLPAKNF